VHVEFETTCGHVQNLAEQLHRRGPLPRDQLPRRGSVTLRLAAEHLVHPASRCPPASSKAIEVEAGLALPKDASIKPRKD